jgi:anti-sigma-K factor RskA
MSEDTHTWGCEECSAELAELALGVLTGRERARALAHVDECPRCAEELEQLSRAADSMLLAAPDAEPPMGFETRLFERMGVSDVPRLDDRRRAPRWVPVGVAAAAAAVAALGVGLGMTLTSSPPPAPVAQGHVHGTIESDNLVQDGRTVGRVVYFDGAKPWMSMMLADAGVQGQVNCVVVGNDGVTHMVGTLVAHNGYGAWYAPLHVNPSDLRAAQVVTPSGTVIASASLT